jgi:L,D-transpeptidase ErfK/SrfK
MTAKAVNHRITEDVEFRPEDTEKKIGLALFLGLLIGLILAFMVFLYAPTLRDYVYWIVPETKSLFIDQKADPAIFDQEIRRVEKRISVVNKKLADLQPQDNYLIVDTSGNEIYLMNNGQVLHKGSCSTGKYVLLKVSKKKEYVFKTPRGQFRVQQKQKRPVWYKPDWAFYEEALPIPPRDSPDRFEEGVLGDYALALGDGYLIHGTLYKRFLGQPVTHGCVRLDDETLEIVFKGMRTNGKVFIY